jgi:hypothetical protein
MIKDLIFLLNQNRLFFSQKGMSQILLWVMIMVVLILVGSIFVAKQNGLIGSNVDSILDWSGGIIGSNK